MAGRLEGPGRGGEQGARGGPRVGARARSPRAHAAEAGGRSPEAGAHSPPPVPGYSEGQSQRGHDRNNGGEGSG